MTLRAAQQFRRWLRILVVLIAASVAVLTIAGLASAHDVLVSSDPVAGAVLAKAPGTVTLVFDQEVQSGFAEMAVTVGSQAPVEFTPTVAGRDVTADLATQNVTIPTGSALTPWKIGYRIVSADGHPVTGLVTFSVGVATVGATKSISAAAPALPTRSAAVTWALIGGAAVLLALAAVVLLWMRHRRGSPQY